MKKSDCNHCICKTCELSHENSNYNGCGDCIKCKSEKMDAVNNCPAYYNSKEPVIKEREEFNE